MSAVVLEEDKIIMTDAQAKSFYALVPRFGLPKKLWLDGYKALMCEFKGILIGIERDGYAHS